MIFASLNYCYIIKGMTIEMDRETSRGGRSMEWSMITYQYCGRHDTPVGTIYGSSNGQYCSTKGSVPSDVQSSMM